MPIMSSATDNITSPCSRAISPLGWTLPNQKMEESTVSITGLKPHEVRTKAYNKSSDLPFKRASSPRRGDRREYNFKPITASKTVTPEKFARRLNPEKFTKFTVLIKYYSKIKPKKLTFRAVKRGKT